MTRNFNNFKEQNDLFTIILIFFVKCFIIFLVLCCLISNSADAITPSFSHSCLRGVDIYYYINGGTSNVLYDRINSAAYNWENTGIGYNPIYLNLQSSNDETAIDFYTVTEGFFGTEGNIVDGRTRYGNIYGVYISPFDNDWLYSDIFINITLISNSQYTVDIQRGIIEHEMGHAFGLEHYTYNDYARSLMYPYTFTINNLRSTIVTYEDNDAINLKY